MKEGHSESYGVAMLAAVQIECAANIDREWLPPPIDSWPMPKVSVS